MLGLGKLKEAKQKAEELKAKLAGMDFEGKSYNDKVSIMCSGDKRFHSLEIDDSIFKIRTREEVQSMVLEAIDRAQMKADATIKEEMSAIMPNIPGMGF
jgi:DNA-binding YbaB/EbfC family protein